MSGEDEAASSAEAISASTIERRKVPCVLDEEFCAYYLQYKPTSRFDREPFHGEKLANGAQYLLLPNHRQIPPIETWLENHELPDLDETGQEIVGRLPEKPVYDEELNTWLAWCYASKVEGLGEIASADRSDKVQGFFVNYDGSGTVHFQSVREVELRRDKLFASLHIGAPPHDKLELGSLNDLGFNEGSVEEFRRVLAYQRWNYENRVAQKEMTTDEILESYSEFYFLLEKTTKKVGRALWPQVSTNLALALALGVPRNEPYYTNNDGSYTPVSLSSHGGSEATLDELDGIMWFAVHALGTQSPRVAEVQRKRAGLDVGEYLYASNFDDGYDVLYPTSNPLRHPTIRPETAYIAMTRLYLQMDDNLKKAWSPILNDVFKKVGNLCRFDIDSYREAGEAWTYNSYAEGDTSMFEKGSWEFRSPLEIVQTVEKYAHTNYHRLGNKPKIHTELVGGKPDSETARYFDSSYDENGKLVLTPKNKSEIAVVEEARRHLRLDVSQEARGVLPEIIRVVDEAMERLENADLDRFASIAAIMERVTGREVSTFDLATMVSDTASLKGAVVEMMQQGLTRDSLDNLGLELDLFEPDFAQMDFSSQMLIILSTIGEKHGVPRQLIIEHMVETMAAAAPLVALRYMKLMEESIRDQRGDPDFELPVYDGAARIADAVKSEGWGSMEHMKIVVEEFGGLVSLLQLYHTYDATTTDMLAFLQQFEESGYAASQCGPFADILREIYTMMHSGPDGESTSHVVYRTMSRSIPLEQWQESLKRGSEMNSGPDGESTIMNYDHVKVVTPLDRPHYDSKRTRTLVTDQTSGEVLLADVVVDEGASRDLEHAVVLENPNKGKCMVSRDGHVFRRDVVNEDYLTYGARDTGLMYPSSVTASIMGEIPELRHLAVLVNPDDPRQITSSWSEIPERRKWTYLNRMLSACPRSLADTGLGGTDKLSAIEINHANFLVDGVSRCVINGHFAGAFFMLDILDHKYGGVVDTDFGKTGQTVSDIFVTRFAGQEAQFDAQLANAKRDGFITEDRAQKLKEVFLVSEALRQKDSDLWKSKKDNAHIDLDRELTGMSEEIKSQVPESDAYKGTGMETEARIRVIIGNFAQEIKGELQVSESETDSLLVKLAPGGGKFAWPIIMRGVEPEDRPDKLKYVAGIVEAAMRCYNMPDSAYVALTDSLQEYDPNLVETLPKLEDVRAGKVRIAMPLGVRGIPALMSGNDL